MSKRSPRRNPPSCQPTARPPRVETPIGVAVTDYIQNQRLLAARELEYFSRVLRSDEDAVEQAALARLPNGHRHPHQRRIPAESLEQSRRRLIENLLLLKTATSFDDLLDLIEGLIRPIPKIGELTVYDTALRVGARLGLQPERVYLHAGTREGARALGFDSRRRTIEMNELPAPIRKLTAREAEDLLCIYKSWFR